MQIGECGIRQVIIDIEDLPRFLEIIRSVGERNHTHIIVFNSEMMAGKDHAISALSHAIRAENEKRRISNSLEMEGLLYASGSRQCIDGMKFGIHEGINRSYLCLCPWQERTWNELSESISPNYDDWEEISPQKAFLLMDLFEITKEEVEITGGLHRIRELVLERIALLDAYR